MLDDIFTYTERYGELIQDVDDDVVEWDGVKDAQFNIHR